MSICRICLLLRSALAPSATPKPSGRFIFPDVSTRGPCCPNSQEPLIVDNHITIEPLTVCDFQQLNNYTRTPSIKFPCKPVQGQIIFLQFNHLARNHTLHKALPDGTKGWRMTARANNSTKHEARWSTLGQGDTNKMLFGNNGADADEAQSWWEESSGGDRGPSQW